jgi:hypothetical protein
MKKNFKGFYRGFHQLPSSIHQLYALLSIPPVLEFYQNNTLGMILANLQAKSKIRMKEDNK